MPSLNGPSLANPGSDVVLTGKADCQTASVSVKADPGGNLPFTSDCDGGDVTITFTMPPCGNPPNIVLVTLTDSNGADSHSIANNCP